MPSRFNFLNQRSAFMIPKRGFTHPEDAQAFLQAARDYWKNPGSSLPSNVSSTNTWPPPPQNAEAVGKTAMQVAYTLTVDDLVRLNRIVVQRHVGMSLWLLYLCGFTLGPVGLLGVWFYACDILSHHHILWADVFGSLMFLFFAWTGFTAVRHLPGSLKRRARDRVRQHPALLQERCLIAVENGLLESAPGTAAQIHEKKRQTRRRRKRRRSSFAKTAPYSQPHGRK